MSNDFKAFATATPGTANSLTPSALAALTTLLANGFQPGIALSEQVNTVLRQATTAAAGVGTFIDDYGPSNAVDNGNASDFSLALKAAIDAVIAANQFWKPGDVKATLNGLLPAGWLACEGALVSRTTYAALFGAIGTTFGAGDGSTTFALPDLRGEFLRGWDLTRGVDPDSPRGLGSFQADALKAHTHDGVPSLQADIDRGSASSNFSVDVNGVTGSTGGAETRPRNVAVWYLIKT